METLSQTPKNPVQFEMCDSFNKAFLASEDVAVGQVVVLTDVGLVRVTDSATQILGIVIKAAKAGNKATVSTNFRAVVRGVAAVNIGIGALVKIYSADTEATIYTTSTEGAYVVGIALEAIDEEESGEIGLFYTPYYVPAV